MMIYFPISLALLDFFYFYFFLLESFEQLQFAVENTAYIHWMHTHFTDQNMLLGTSSIAASVKGPMLRSA